MKKLYILFGISILIITGFLTTPTEAQACNNYAFDSNCRTHQVNRYRNDDIYAFGRRNNYAFQPESRYRNNYAFDGNNYRNYYPKYAFYSHQY